MIQFDSLRRYAVVATCLITVAVLTLPSCNESTIVGSDIFDGRDLQINNIDTLTVKAKTVRIDSIRTYNLRDVNLTTYLIGELEDPYFGKNKASLITEVHYTTESVPPRVVIPDYRDSDVLDSMILVLYFDNQGLYGDSSATHDIEVFRVTEDLRTFDELYSNRIIMTDPTPIASASNVSLNFDSVEVYNPELDQTLTESPQLRIPMGDDISNELFTLFNEIETDSAFVSAFRGIKVESTPSKSSVFGVTIDNRSFNSRLLSYYSRGDTSLIYEYGLNDLSVGVPFGRKFTEFEQEIDDAIVTEFTTDTSMENLLFIEASVGHVVELDLSSLLTLDDVLINRAELEVVVANLDDYDMGIFPPIDNLIMSTLDENGNSQPIDEVDEGIMFNQLDQFFGGSVESFTDNGQQLFRYKMNISRTVIKILNGEIGPIVTISPLSVNDRVSRSILNGPDHPEYPIKLNVTLTVL